MGMVIHVFHVHLMNVVLQTPPFPSHPTVFFAIQIRHHAALANQDTTFQEGYV